MEGVGVIVNYKFLEGSNAGKIYSKRFETDASFIEWCKTIEKNKTIRILSTNIVESSKLYWSRRWA